MNCWPKRCARCRHLIYPSNRQLAWTWTHEGRGLCGPCYQRCLKTGEHLDYDPVTYSRDELLAEWEWLRREGFSKRQAAARLGMRYETFDRAYHRARRAGDPRAVPGVAVAA